MPNATNRMHPMLCYMSVCDMNSNSSFILFWLFQLIRISKRRARRREIVFNVPRRDENENAHEYVVIIRTFKKNII